MIKYLKYEKLKGQHDLRMITVFLLWLTEVMIRTGAIITSLDNLTMLYNANILSLTI